MKSIQVIEKDNIQMVEVPEPSITRPGQVKVKIQAVGICGSDVGILRGKNPFATYPRIIGHEIAGQVIELGDSVHHLKIGDKVVLEPIEYCNKCYACTHGMHNVCKSLEVYGVHRDGGFCEFMVTDQSKWHKVDPGISYVQACVAEPYTIAENVTSRTNVIEDDWVLITGAGPMGLLTADIANSKGGKVIVSEVNDYRRGLAKDFGANYIIDPRKETISSAIQEITNGEGINVFIDSTGILDVIREGIDNLSPASRFTPLAFGGEDLPISFKTLNQKQIQISGSRLQYEKFPIVTSYLAEKVDKIDKLVNYVFHADDYQDAFSVLLKKGTDAIKVVLTFD